MPRRYQDDTVLIEFWRISAICRKLKSAHRWLMMVSRSSPDSSLSSRLSFSLYSSRTRVSSVRHGDRKWIRRCLLGRQGFFATDPTLRYALSEIHKPQDAAVSSVNERAYKTPPGRHPQPERDSR